MGQLVSQLRGKIVGELVRQLLGAVLTPMCFMLFFQTGQVGAVKVKLYKESLTRM